MKDNESRPIEPFENAQDYINMGFEVIHQEDVSEYGSDDDAASFVILSRNQQWSDPKRPNPKFGPYQTVLYVAPFAPYGPNNARSGG